MDQERENSATRYSGSHREGHDDIGRGSRGASPDEIGQDARSTKRKESDEELGVDEEMAHTSSRYGLGRFSTEEEVDRAVALTVEHVAKLREMSPLWEMVQEGVDLKSIQWSQH